MTCRRTLFSTESVRLCKPLNVSEEWYDYTSNPQGLVCGNHEKSTTYFVVRARLVSHRPLHSTCAGNPVFPDFLASWQQTRNVPPALAERVS